MYTFMKLTPEEFQAHQAQFTQANFLQTIEMKQVQEQNGWYGEFVGLKDDQGAIVASSLLTHTKLGFGQLYLINGGMMVNEDDQTCLATFLAELTTYTKKNQGLTLTIAPNQAKRWLTTQGEVLKEAPVDYDKTYLQQGFTIDAMDSDAYISYGKPFFIKDLSDLTLDTLRSSYTKSAQYSVKKTKDYGIVLRELSYEELPKFKKLTEETSERRGFSDKSLAYYQAFFNAFGQKAKFVVAEINFETYKENLVHRAKEIQSTLDEINDFLTINPKSRKKNNQKREFEDELRTVQVRIEEAEAFSKEEPGEVILAGALFAIESTEVVYLFSGTYEKYKKFYAPYLIQDYMMQEAIARQIPRYNFYGIEGVYDGSDGVLKFKDAFNGQVEERFGVYTKVVSPMKYQAYRMLKGILNRIRH
ncbi:aminoacyltransferase [Enterococcus bulliens]